MVGKSTAFGIAMRNFQTYPEIPDSRALIDYGVRAEELGYESLWVWDHILLGVDPHFPIIDSLSLLTAVAARTQTIKLGTGILVLPLRNPVVLAKQLSSIDRISAGRLVLGVAAGWYKREFDAVGIDFHKRGNIMDQNLEILKRLWQEDMVTGNYPPHNLRNAVMFPKPVQKPRPTILIGGYVDRVLKRAAVAGDGWLTYFYTPQSYGVTQETSCPCRQAADERRRLSGAPSWRDRRSALAIHGLGSRCPASARSYGRRIRRLRDNTHRE